MRWSVARKTRVAVIACCENGSSKTCVAIPKRCTIGTVLARQGSSEAAIAQAERAIALAPGDGRIRYNAACTYAQCGMPERAIEQLKEGVKNLPDYIAAWPQRDPDLASIHDDPEFIRLFGSAQRN
jgi:tetratricopeptide (TPR) repeat protein